jgi:hypothetical protein
VHMDVLSRPPDQVTEDRTQHRAGNDHPDQSGVTGGDQKVDPHGLSVLDNEKNERDENRQHRNGFGNHHPAGFGELLPMMLVFALGIKPGSRCGCRPLPTVLSVLLIQDEDSLAALRFASADGRAGVPIEF